MWKVSFCFKILADTINEFPRHKNAGWGERVDTTTEKSAVYLLSTSFMLPILLNSVSEEQVGTGVEQGTESRV